jgi:hypothetical protein
LYFHTRANPPETVASQAAAAIHVSLEASLDLPEAGALSIANITIEVSAVRPVCVEQESAIDR